MPIGRAEKKTRKKKLLPVYGNVIAAQKTPENSALIAVNASLRQKAGYAPAERAIPVNSAQNAAVPDQNQTHGSVRTATLKTRENSAVNAEKNATDQNFERDIEK